MSLSGTVRRSEQDRFVYRPFTQASPPAYRGKGDSVGSKPTIHRGLEAGTHLPIVTFGVL
jgi:hypothetical protein